MPAHNEQWFNGYLKLSSKNLSGILSQIELTLAKKPTTKQKEFIRLVVLNFIHYDYRAIALSLGTDSYYKCLPFGKDVVRNSVALLGDYLEVTKGRHIDKRCSTIRASSKLRLMLKRLDKEAKKIRNEHPLIILQETEKSISKSGKKKRTTQRIPYKTTRYIEDKARAVKIINEHLQSAKISVNGKEIASEFLQLKRIFSTAHIDFNENVPLSQDNSYGGRFFHASWLECRAHERLNITINNNPVTELDFKAMHINLLYMDLRKEVYKDGRDNYPYDIQIFYGDSYNKEVSKAVINTLLNTDSYKSAASSLGNRKSLQSFGTDDWLGITPVTIMRVLKITTGKLINIILKHHPVIKEIHDKGLKSYGLRLQFMEAEIMEAILLKSIELGIIILPVHDGLVCESHNKDAVSKIMLEEYLSYKNLPYDVSLMKQLIKEVSINNSYSVAGI